jgi:hypothetical protein
LWVTFSPKGGVLNPKVIKKATVTLEFPVRGKGRKHRKQFFRVGAYGVFIVYVKRGGVLFGQNSSSRVFVKGKVLTLMCLLCLNQRKNNSLRVKKAQVVSPGGFNSEFGRIRRLPVYRYKK